MQLNGVIQSGVGKGAFFMQVDWVVQQCQVKLGFTPYPGTLNVHVRGEDLPELERLMRTAALCLNPDDADFCSARVQPVSIRGIPAAVVLPSEDVRIHEHRIIEVIAPCNLKRAFRLEDGDSVCVSSPSAPQAVASPALYREIYEFAASAGALEGFLYGLNKLDPSELEDWVRNLAAQHRELPSEARVAFQSALNRTLGRAIHSLAALIGEDHRHVETLRSLVDGELPSAADDFEEEKVEKAARFSGDRD